MKKGIAFALAGLLALGLAGCGQKPADNADAGKPVTLRWTMPGPGEQQDSAMVWEEFNKQLKTYPGMENVTIEFDVIAQADYAQKFLLSQTGGEKMDIVQTYTLDFANEVRNGSFMEISDLIDTYSPDLRSGMPDWMWGFGEVDGKLYMVPVYQQMNAVVWGLHVPKEYSDKYWDVEEARRIFIEEPYFNEKCYDVVEKYLTGVRDAGEIGTGFNGGVQTNKGYETIAKNYVVSYFEDKPTVYNNFQSQASKLKYMKMGEWFEKGFIRKDALSAKRDDDNGRKGGNVAWFDQTLKGEEARDSLKYGFDIVNVPLQDDFFVPCIAAAGGNCIAASSENPETAIRFLELMNTQKGKDLYNLLVYGLEGTHYNKVGDDKIETLDYVSSPTSSSKYGLWKWIVGNASMAYDTQAEFDGWKEYIFEEVNEGPNTVRSKLIGFTPNLKPIETKLAQVTTVCNEYGTPLGSGALPDYQEKYEEFMEKLDKAGNQEIIDELQRQVDEFLAGKQ